MNTGSIVAIIVSVVIGLLFLTLVTFALRYKRCPADKIMVISGKTRNNKDGTARSAKCIHGGAAFVMPLVQEFAFLDLTPMALTVDLKNALSKQNIRINVPSRFTVGISTEPGVMQNAAERLLGLSNTEIQDLASEMIFGQLRLVVATMNIEEINTDRDKFLDAISRNVEGELKKIGLKLINVNMTDITDESGYIEALGREAAATAVNEAKVKVAEADLMGNTGEAGAVREQRIVVASAESAAIKGENTAKAEIADSQALLREKQAEALKRAVSAEKIQSAKALEESYHAEQQAEKARSLREIATQEADVIVKSEIARRKAEIDADAIAEQIKRRAKGEAEAIFMKMEAEARGMKEMLSKQAEGLASLVKASGGSADDTVRLIISQKLEELVRTQVEAVKNIKIDKITVWDGGQTGTDGKTSTANFMSGLMKSLPPLEELFGMAGLTLPKVVNPNPEVVKGGKPENKVIDVKPTK